MSGAYWIMAAPGGVDWRIALSVAALPAIAAVIAAVIAARSAKVAKSSEVEAQRLRELESRISEKKYDTYKPMINTLKDMLDRRAVNEETFRANISEFAIWVAIFGSDEAVRSFHNFMQASFNPPTPPVVFMRLYADFVLAARRDMGYLDTSSTRKEILGSRITDVYSHSMFSNMDKPFEDLCREAEWQPSWL
ncbi:hypothetical protein [Streptomyces sp. NPDC006274]|uniref:hypothetical protein n=1 Tax=unclassified Streptomyces TaxID=2593676 RepID=UPI0033BEE8CC